MRAGESVVSAFLGRSFADPEALALVDDETRTSYAELEQASRALAVRLGELGLGREDVVSIAIPKSREAVVAILGVLRAGAAYLPLDMTAPDSRTRSIITDSQAKLTLVPSDADTSALERFQTISMDELLRVGDSLNPGPRAPEDGDLAYIIYTSGSTGTPKGVALEHGSLAHSTFARFQFYSESPTSFLLVSPLWFDSSVAGLFWTLCGGGTLLLPPRQVIEDPFELAAFAARHEASHLLCVPSYYGTLLDTEQLPKSLTTVIVAGETCSRRLVEKHASLLESAVLVNEYGPTEAAVWATACICRANEIGSDVPVGAPVPGVNVKLIDQDCGAEVAPGETGEIHIAGPTVARGYVRRPSLTAERFVPDPSCSGGRMYRTGDLGRFDAGGRLMFLGRADRQVKIRGNRVELEEVEAALNRLSGVRNAVALALSSSASGTSELVAAIEAGKETNSVAVIRAALEERLPPWMVPSQLRLVEAFPATSNGKVDRDAVAASFLADKPLDEGVGSELSVAESVNKILAEFLGSENVSPESNFFEVGGHSLMAAQVIVRIRRELTVPVPLRALFDHPTLGDFVGSLAREAHAG